MPGVCIYVHMLKNLIKQLLFFKKENKNKNVV